MTAQAATQDQTDTPDEGEKQPQSFGSMIDEMYEFRDKKAS